MPSRHAEAPDDRARWLAMINANWMTQAIGTAVALALPSRLAEAPQHVDTLALACGCHAPSLHRLLRALASLGLCDELGDARFGLTPLGALLRPDAPDSLHAWARLRSAQWAAWGQFEQSVTSGEGWRKRTLGADDFSHLDADPQAAALFHGAMVALTRRIATDVLRVVEIADHERVVVDVGGGSGEMLIALLLAHPALRGSVFDLEHARAGAARQFEAAGMAQRCEFVAGSFFDSVPAGADVLVLKSVLHDWDDARCAVILRQCRAAMAAHARLLVVERIAPERFTDTPQHRAIAGSDLNMRVALSGRERREADFRALLGDAALRVTRIAPTGGEFHVIEARAG